MSRIGGCIAQVLVYEQVTEGTQLMDVQLGGANGPQLVYIANTLTNSCSIANKQVHKLLGILSFNFLAGLYFVDSKIIEYVGSWAKIPSILLISNSTWVFRL